MKNVNLNPTSSSWVLAARRDTFKFHVMLQVINIPANGIYVPIFHTFCDFMSTVSCSRRSPESAPLYRQPPL